MQRESTATSGRFRASQVPDFQDKSAAVRVGHHEGKLLFLLFLLDGFRLFLGWFCRLRRSKWRWKTNEAKKDQDTRRCIETHTASAQASHR